MVEYLEVDQFVSDAWDNVDPEANATGNSPNIPKKRKKRAIAKFYQLCAKCGELNATDKTNITKHLRRMKSYGGPKAVIRSEDWVKIQAIQGLTRSLYCKSGTGVTPKY
ncbi:hypothetical protein ACFL4N_08495 [Thermodesulfobacteriota bacterium]